MFFSARVRTFSEDGRFLPQMTQVCALLLEWRLALSLFAGHGRLCHSEVHPRGWRSKFVQAAGSPLPVGSSRGELMLSDRRYQCGVRVKVCGGMQRRKCLSAHSYTDICALKLCLKYLSVYSALGRDFLVLRGPSTTLRPNCLFVP